MKVYKYASQPYAGRTEPWPHFALGMELGQDGWELTHVTPGVKEPEYSVGHVVRNGARGYLIKSKTPGVLFVVEYQEYDMAVDQATFDSVVKSLLNEDDQWNQHSDRGRWTIYAAK